MIDISSRRRYWLMVILGVGIMLGVSAWNGMMIDVTTQATRRDIARTVRTVVIADMHEAMESTRL